MINIKTFNGTYRQGRELSLWLQTQKFYLGFRIGKWFRLEYVVVESKNTRRYYFGPFCIEYIKNPTLVID